MIIYLYVKQHSITGLKYFGRTISSDPFRYMGSGIYWNNHLNKHGKEHVRTICIWFFTDQEKCTKFALKFSKDNDIVKSKNWANLIDEDGLSGGWVKTINIGRVWSEERRNNHSIAMKNRNWKPTEEHKKRISEKNIGKEKSIETIELTREKNIGRKRTPEQCAKIAIAQINSPNHSTRGKKRPEHASKMSKIMKGKKLSKHSQEANKAKSLRMKGVKKPLDFGQKISEAKKGKKPKQATCPHCCLSGSITCMKRWHFDNCKKII